MGSAVFLAQAVALAAVPYLGGTVLAGAALTAVGVLNGFGNVLMITLFQRWAPPGLMGRLAGLLTMASMGVAPLSVALAALVVNGLGAAVFFPLAAAALALAILAGLSQRTWRDFGAVRSRRGGQSPAPAPRPPGRVQQPGQHGHRGEHIMNFGMIDVLVGDRAGDIGRPAASRRAAARGRGARRAAGAAQARVAEPAASRW